MPKIAALVLALCALGAAHAACTPPPGAYQRLESAGTVLYYRSHPAAPDIGAHFALDVTVCAKSGSAPTQLDVDATMPEHGHGMNTRAKVNRVGSGQWRAEGLMFHMPGRWRLRFAVRTAAGSDRLVRELHLE